MDWIYRYPWFILALFGHTLVQCLVTCNEPLLDVLECKTPQIQQRVSQCTGSVILQSSQFLGNSTASTVSSTRTRETSIITSSLSKPSLPSSTSLPPTTIRPAPSQSTVLPSSVNNSPGFCARYTAETCRDILSETLTHYNETKRFFDKKQGMNRTEFFLQYLVNEVEKQKSDAHCGRLIKVVICQYTLSPCLPNGDPVKFCRENCESLRRECGELLNRLLGSASTLVQLKDFNFTHLMLPNDCTKFRSRKSNDSCVLFEIFERPRDHPSSANKTILWSSIGAGILFSITIIAIIVIVSLKRRRQRKKERELREMIELDMEESTMKARIRQTSEMRLFSAKVADMYDPEKLRQISLDKIEYVSDLGEGQFGLVFKGMAIGIDDTNDPSHRTPVAVKTLKAESYEDCKDEFDQEVALMSILDNANIIKLLGVATEEDPHCMIFEFMELGDLNQFLRKVKPLDVEETQDIKLSCDDFLKICSQVASGMLYLASLHFVHRDLAARNCLVAKNLTVKIADFGLSRDIYSSEYYKVRGDAMLPIRWMPPEALLYGRFTVKSDIYSYGVLMWEVFTYGLQPFYGYSNEEVMAFAKEAALLGQPDDCPMHIYNLMRDCWARNSEKRPDFDTIIERLDKNPPPPSVYSTLRIPSGDANESNGMEKTIVTKKPPTTSSNQTTGTYQTPGTIINVGFVTDDQVQKNSVMSGSQQQSSEVDQEV